MTWTDANRAPRQFIASLGHRFQCTRHSSSIRTGSIYSNSTPKMAGSMYINRAIPLRIANTKMVPDRIEGEDRRLTRAGNVMTYNIMTENSVSIQELSDMGVCIMHKFSRAAAERAGHLDEGHSKRSHWCAIPAAVLVFNGAGCQRITAPKTKI